MSIQYVTKLSKRKQIKNTTGYYRYEDPINTYTWEANLRFISYLCLYFLSLKPLFSLSRILVRCMAVSILAREVSDLCLGKPPLRLLPITSTVAESITALRRSGESYVSVWSCESTGGDYTCVGKICMVDVICYLCNKENIARPLAALNSPVSEILSKPPGIVRHLEANTRFVICVYIVFELPILFILGLARLDFSRFEFIIKN